jgi:hypothetical protein
VEDRPLGRRRVRREDHRVPVRVPHRRPRRARAGLIVIVGKTLQTIERNVLEPLQDPNLFGALASKTVKHTRGSNTATILGREVHLVGANDIRSEEKIRGSTIEIAYVDEATLLPPGSGRCSSPASASRRPPPRDHEPRLLAALAAREVHPRRRPAADGRLPLHDARQPPLLRGRRPGPAYIADMEAAFRKSPAVLRPDDPRPVDERRGRVFDLWSRTSTSSPGRCSPRCGASSASASTTAPPTPRSPHRRFEEHGAWWAGDTATLAEIYSGRTGTTTHVRAGIPYRGGVIGALSKMWWGQPQEPNERRMKMHLPVPADLAQLSADLLFAEAPKIRYSKPAEQVAAEEAETAKNPDAEIAPWTHPGQDRLNTIMGSDEAHAQMLIGGEFAAALGGTYFAVTWDSALVDHVWIRAFAADCAIPEFRYGRMTACTLWTEFRTENAGAVYRLLERHEPGTITYELHEGGPNNLGPMVSLGTLPETAHYDDLRVDVELQDLDALTDAVSLSVTVATGVPKLAVGYMPNAMPVRDWRKLGPLANLGRSDFAGVEDLFDKIDQVWSSLMRDIENGAGRITVPSAYLDQGKPGEGATFDPNRTVYVGLDMLGGAGDSLSSQIQETQFDIRVVEHLATIDALKREIATTCGYSPSHLGLTDVKQGGTKTATEVSADLSDSERTRDKKALYAKPVLAQIAQVALAIDGQVFPGKGGAWYDDLPDVEFADVSQVDPLKRAQTIQVLYAAEAIALRSRVAAAHPDWDDDQIDTEARQLRDEIASAPASSPITAPFGGGLNPEDLSAELDQPEQLTA